jgi:outer membrane protein OmpA-like peptidoglycan-associated protein
MGPQYVILGFAFLLAGPALAQELDIQVQLTNAMGTDISRKGDPVSAQVVSPPALQGDIVEGKVNESKAGNKFGGKAVLRFSFDTLRHGGQAIGIAAQVRSIANSKGQANVDEEGTIVRGSSSNLAKAAGGTGLGALVGGLAGGGRGAAIGAVSGAAISVVLIEVAAQGPTIRLAPGARVFLSARSRGGPELSSLGPNAPTTAPTASNAPAGYAPAPAAAPYPAQPNTVQPNPGQPTDAAPAQPDFTALKDDFIPGEKVILYDDFTDMAPDEAPPHWKVRGNSVTLLASGELRQLNVGNRTTLTPSIKSYPKNFTVEQDMKFGEKGCEFSWCFYSANDHNNAALEVHGGTDHDELRIWAKTLKESLVDTNITVDWHAPIKNAIWLQNGRLRIYYNGQKAGDFNQLELPDFDYAQLLVNNFRDGPLSFTRIRIAESTPDFSKIIMADGRYVTHGILFDTGSDRIKSESAAVIKSIAAGLLANPNLSLKIEGHTDSTGDAALNLDLSKRRAAAVKKVLVAEFKIEDARLSTDGLGSTKPIDSNDTPQGRAQNRRVEFVRQ